MILDGIIITETYLRAKNKEKFKINYKLQGLNNEKGRCQNV